MQSFKQRKKADSLRL